MTKQLLHLISSYKSACHTHRAQTPPRIQMRNPSSSSSSRNNASAPSPTVPSPSPSPVGPTTTTTTSSSNSKAGLKRAPSPSPSPSPSPVAPTTSSSSKAALKRGPWTPEEDLLLSNYIKKEGEGKWRTLPKKAGLLRCGKSCRLRWMNYLRPSVKRGHIAPDEEDLILRLHRLLGNRSMLIYTHIYIYMDLGFLCLSFNTISLLLVGNARVLLSKKLISQGIDPRTHKPLLVEPNYDNKQPPAPSSICPRGTPRDRGILAPDLPPSNPITNDSTFALPFVEPQEQQHIAATLEGNIQHDHNNFLPSSEMTTTTAGNGNENIMHNIIPDGADDLYGMMSIREGFNNEDDQGDINCCSDDVFSSFLNSLIAEDAFINSQSLEHDVDADAAAAALISSTSTPLFTFGPGWEAPATACPPSRDHENDSQMLNKGNENS